MNSYFEIFLVENIYAMKERIDRRKKELAEAKQKSEAEQMAQYMAEEQTAEASKVMKERIEKQKRELAAKKKM